MDFFKDEELAVIEKIVNFTHFDNLVSVDWEQKDKFLNNKIGLEYIGYFIRSINDNLYCLYKEILKKDVFDLSEQYKVHDSQNSSLVLGGVIKDTKIMVPPISCPVNLFVASHEVGHALSNFNNINNSRNFYNGTIYSETISILFGKLCELRYLNDFGEDNNVLAFEVINVNNALNCIERVKNYLVKYKETVEKIKTIDEPKNRSQAFKLSELKSDLVAYKSRVRELISYAIGISLLNYYLKLDEDSKELYLEMVTKYIMTNVAFDYKIVLNAVGINLEPTILKDNFLEYVSNVKTKVIDRRKL